MPVMGSTPEFFVPLKLLHQAHASHKLVSSEVPPSARGKICSTCIGAPLIRCDVWQ